METKQEVDTNTMDFKENTPNADTSDLEQQIDKLIYQLYNLTPEEITVIEQ